VTTSADRLLGPLLDALLAARTHPGADAFDQAVAAAVEAGTLTADLGHQLRHWQRASVHEVTDYVRTVLPSVLPGALAAVTAAEDDATYGAASAAQAWSGAHEPAPVDVPAPAQAVLSAPDVIVLPDTAEDLDAPVDPPDAPDQADEELSRHHARRRLFVAGLTSTA
jgi:hypothetical protein